MPHARRATLIFAAALCGLLLVACGQEESAPVEEAAAPAAPAEPAAAAGAREARAERRAARREAREARGEAADPAQDEAGEDRIAAMQERVRERRQWWNDEALAAEFGLDEAQRQALADRSAQFEQQRQAVRDRRRGGERDFRDALAAGDLEAARRAADALAEAVAEQERLRRMHQVEMLEIMDADQRQQLMARGGGRMAGAMQRLRERSAANDDDGSDGGADGDEE